MHILQPVTHRYFSGKNHTAYYFMIHTHIISTHVVYFWHHFPKTKRKPHVARWQMRREFQLFVRSLFHKTSTNTTQRSPSVYFECINSPTIVRAIWPLIDPREERGDREKKTKLLYATPFPFFPFCYLLPPAVSIWLGSINHIPLVDRRPHFDADKTGHPNPETSASFPVSHFDAPLNRFAWIRSAAQTT